jgi:copper chaperone CopZ
MISPKQFLVAFLFLVFCCNSYQVYGVEIKNTTIDIKGMHCSACAAKVAKNLEQITGVTLVHVDATKANAVITPADNAMLDPRMLWEAVEKAGYLPLKLVGPSGTFTMKP